MGRRRRRKRVMISVLVVGLLVLAIAGWSVQGVRWLIGCGRRLAPAT